MWAILCMNGYDIAAHNKKWRNVKSFTSLVGCDGKRYLRSAAIGPHDSAIHSYLSKIVYCNEYGASDRRTKELKRLRKEKLVKVCCGSCSSDSRGPNPAGFRNAGEISYPTPRWRAVHRCSRWARRGKGRTQTYLLRKTQESRRSGCRIRIKNAPRAIGNERYCGEANAPKADDRDRDGHEVTNVAIP